jgi:tripartite-type tricarboxylate transporter receptor subunit TctC
VKHLIHRRSALALLGGLAAFTHASAQAADPLLSRPVRLIVPAGPGSTIDGIARVLGPLLSAKWGQPVVVENMAGAGGVIGTQAVVRASADSLTLGLVASNLAVSPALLKKPPYDLAKDFSYIACLASAPMVLYANAALAATTFAELQQLGASTKDGLTFSSAGIGSTGHLTGELIVEATGLPLKHVAYKAVGQALTDAIGGQVDLFIAAASVGAEHVKAGRFKAIAHTGRGRLPTLPAVPSLVDAGFPGVKLEAWFGVIAPAWVPAAIRARIERDVLAAVQSSAFKEHVALQGLVPSATGGEAFATLVKLEAHRWQGMSAKGIISAQ